MFYILIIFKFPFYMEISFLHKNLFFLHAYLSMYF